MPRYKQFLLYYIAFGFGLSVFLICKLSSFINVFSNYSLCYVVTFFPEYFMFSFNFEPISILFVVLSFILIFFSSIYSWFLKYNRHFFLGLILLLLWLFFNIFIVSDLFYFFFFFEIILLPMFLLVGIWGTRERKLYAAFQLFFFTVVGSVCFLIGFFLIYMHFGTSNLVLLDLLSISDNRKFFCWFCLFLSVAIKVPVFPLHLWLPEAHVEAPTVGSVLLAGLILKLGLYVLFKYMFVFFTKITLEFSVFVSVFALISSIFAAFVSMIQIDLKRAIAYSSVAHMNLVLLGFFSFELDAVLGAILMMLSHGFVSSSLFILIGFIYERYKTRNLLYYGGILRANPKLAFFFIFFSLANMGFPGTFSYITETEIFLGLMSSNSLIAFISGFSIILSAAGSLVILVRVFFGLYKAEVIHYSGDLTFREFLIIVFFFVLVFFFGISMNSLVQLLSANILYIVSLF